MKRILSIVLCAAMIMALPIMSYADVDLSGMSYDELVALREQIDNTIKKLSPDSSKPASNSTTADTTALQPDEDGIYPLEIKEYGCSLVGGKWLYYGIKLYNPNMEHALYLPSYRITARDADGFLLGTKDQVCNMIYPQQYLAFGSQAFEVTELPSSFEIQALKLDDFKIKRANTLEHPDFIPLEVVNYIKRDGKILGEIANTNDYDIEKAIVTTIYRNSNGEICGGNNTFVDDIGANSSAPFEMRVQKEFEDCSYEIYTGLW